MAATPVPLPQGTCAFIITLRFCPAAIDEAGGDAGEPGAGGDADQEGGGDAGAATPTAVAGAAAPAS
jgi:hypothetical protein